MKYVYNLTNNITGEKFSWETLIVGKIPKKMYIDESLDTVPPNLTESQMSTFTHLRSLVGDNTDLILGDYKYNIESTIEEDIQPTKYFRIKNKVTGDIITWNESIAGSVSNAPLSTSNDEVSLSAYDASQFVSMESDGLTEDHAIGSIYIITKLDDTFKDIQRLQEVAGLQFGKNSIYFNSGSVNNYLKNTDTTTIDKQNDHSEYPEVEVIKFKDEFKKSNLVAPSTENTDDQVKFDKFSTGTTLSKSRKINVPANLIPEITNRIRELDDSKELFFNNENTNQSAINSAITVLEQIKVYFKEANEYSLHEAQLLINKLASQIRDLLPAKTIKYIYTGNFKYSRNVNMSIFEIPERETTNT